MAHLCPIHMSIKTKDQTRSHWFPLAPLGKLSHNGRAERPVRSKAVECSSKQQLNARKTPFNLLLFFVRLGSLSNVKQKREKNGHRDTSGTINKSWRSSAASVSTLASLDNRQYHTFLPAICWPSVFIRSFSWHHFGGKHSRMFAVP